MNWSAEDVQYMARALRLARHGWYTTAPNPRVGCVMVKDGVVIAEGWHQRAGDAHAEVNAIAAASADLKGASCYVTLEPCCHQGKTAACTQALQKSGIAKVIAAMTDPNPLVAGQGLEALEQRGINTAVGLLAEQAQALNPGFIKRMQQGMPFVRCKVAISVDAKSSLHNGVSQWITSQPARQDVQYLRAASSAVLTGVNTVLADNPSLNVRLDDWQGLQPLRVIVDSELRTPTDARILQLPSDTVIVTIAENNPGMARLISKGAEVVQLKANGGQVDLTALMHWLAEEKQINDVLLEAGPGLSGAMLDAQLVDELIVYQAPLLMGSPATSVLRLPAYVSMDECMRLELRDHRMIGRDQRSTYAIQY